ncbi:MAG: hypothetical protein FWD36_01465 [Treponema sp.]|nr:hypothetical protein [Treponema sp.]
MKQRVIFFLTIALLTANSGSSLDFSGILDSTVALRAGAGEAAAFSFGIEEYANIRMQARLREQAVFYGAFNVIAAAGDYAADAAMLAAFTDAATPPGINSTAYVYGENYIAGIELERLHFRLNGEIADFDGGLMRIPFGYGQIWGPSDFLNPKNPLKPDARPRAILGGAVSFYPSDFFKLLGFGAAPQDPFSPNEGFIAGLSADYHWDKMSLQGLYSFELPKPGSQWGIYHAGISVKADLEAGLVMDALYTYNHEANTKIDGLSFSIGADYSFFNGSLIVLAEYLYNGETSSTALGFGGGFSNNHYLYTGFTWRFNDFTNAGLALISGFDDVSFTPVVSVHHELFQGATLMVSAQLPLDRDLFSGDGNRGELGPLPPGSPIGRYFDCSVKLRLRF